MKNHYVTKNLLKLTSLLRDIFFINYLTLRQFFGGQHQIISRREATFFGDRFATTNYVPFLDDKRFLEVYENSLRLPNNEIINSIRDLNISWRAHIVTWAANQVKNLEGDFIECGVWFGFLSKIICDHIEIDKTSKKFYLVDTWGDPNLSEINHPNFTNDIYDLVSQRFNEYKNVELVRGFVPEVLQNLPIKKIAYLSIDLNGYIAERATLEQYYNLMVPGGIIYFDDYGWEYPKLRETIDDFFKDKPETLLHFPSGNSIVIKSTRDMC